MSISIGGISIDCIGFGGLLVGDVGIGGVVLLYDSII